MKKIFILGLLTLSTLTQAATVSVCNGLLIAKKTKAFGASEYIIEAKNWKLTADGVTATITEGQISMSGSVKNGVVTLHDDEKTSQMTLSEITDEDGQKQFLKVVGKTSNKSGQTVANISGQLSCK